MKWMIDILIIVLTASIISGYQAYRCLKYLKNSIRLTHGYETKINQGTMQLWEYIFLFVPFRYRDYYNVPGLQGGNFYLTPIVFLLSLFGNKLIWCGILICVLFSLGGGVFKLFSKFMLRLPFYWGYFASLGIIWASVETAKGLNCKNLLVIIIICGIMLLFNRDWLPVFPYNMWTKKPSEYFETKELKWLEENSKGLRVNNLPYPVYHGQINHIKSMGYMGGNHIAEQGKLRGISSEGAGGYDWFDFLPDGKKLDDYRVGFHMGYRPKDKKWKKIKGFNIWKNTKLS